jgi:hypothetical protein
MAQEDNREYWIHKDQETDDYGEFQVLNIPELG